MVTSFYGLRLHTGDGVMQKKGPGPKTYFLARGVRP